MADIADGPFVAGAATVSNQLCSLDVPVGDDRLDIAVDQHGQVADVVAVTKNMSLKVRLCAGNAIGLKIPSVPVLKLDKEGRLKTAPKSAKFAFFNV